MEKGTELHAEKSKELVMNNKDKKESLNDAATDKESKSSNSMKTTNSKRSESESLVNDEESNEGAKAQEESIEKELGDDNGQTDGILDVAKAQSEEMNKDALLNDLESQLIEAKSKIESLQQNSAQQQNEIKEQQSTISKLREDSRTKDELIRAKSDKEEETQLYESRTQRLQRENDDLRGEISRLNKLKADLSKNLSQNEAEKLLSSNSLLPLQLEIDRVKSDHNSLSSHCSWLENEVKKRVEQIASLKQTHSDQVHRLEAACSALEIERDSFSTKVTALEKECVSLQESETSLQKDKLEMQRKQADELYSKEEEVLAEKKLSTLLKQKADSLEDRIEGLSKETSYLKHNMEAAIQEKAQLLTQVENLRQDMSTKEKELFFIKSKFSSKEEEVKKLQTDLNLFMDNNPIHNEPHNTDTIVITSPDEEQGQLQQPLTITNLLDRLSKAESERRNAEYSKRKLELYLQRIQIDIESKAPKLKQQRVEYEKAIQNEQAMHERCMELEGQLKNAKDDVAYYQSQLNEANSNLKETEQIKVDLANQVQTLLRSSAGEKLNDSDDMIGFTSIEELQNQNQRLLQEYRSANTKYETLKLKADKDSTISELEAAKEELLQLREERERQGVLMEGIVQQRDLYRALLSKQDGELQAIEDGVNTKNTAIEKEKQAAAALREEIQKVKSENVLLNESNKRLESISNELTATIDKLQTDVLTSNKNGAKLQAEVNFFKERLDRSEISIESVKKDISLKIEQEKELKKINEELERVLIEQRNVASNAEQKSKQAESKLMLTETQLQTSKASEHRMKVEIEALRSEISKHSSLFDSLQKIELSLTSRNANDDKALKQELEVMKKTLENERTSNKKEISEMLDRIKDYELQVLNMQKGKEKEMKTVLNSKESLESLENQLKESQLKCEDLSKQLSEAKGAGTDVSTSGSLSTDLESTKLELSKSQERLKEYQLVAKTAEQSLRELRNASTEYKTRSEKEIEELRMALESSKKDLNDKQKLAEEFSSELLKEQKEYESTVSSLKAEINELKSEISFFKKEAQDAKVKELNLSKDLCRIQDESVNAQKNYERELNMHASVRSELRTVKSEVDTEKLMRKKVEMELKNTKEIVEKEKKVLSDKCDDLQSAIDELEKSLEGSREQNRLLHSQLANLTERIENITKQKVEEAKIDLINTNDEKDEALQNKDEEQIELQKSLTEYRGIVNYMRSEQELLQSQINSLQLKLKRENTVSSIAKATLDETKSELDNLRKEMEKRREVNDETYSNEAIKESALFKSAQEQLSILRESNVVLREQTERLKLKLDTVSNDFKDLKKAVEPTEQKVSSLEIEKASWEEEKQSLKRESEVWKNRVQSFLSKFNQIDADEHQKLKDKVEACQKELKNSQNLKERADQECASAKSLVSRLNNQISELKKTNDQKKRDNEKQQKASTEKLKKERDELTSSNATLGKEIESVKSELASSMNRAENLAGMLRKYKGVMEELKGKHLEAVKKEQQALKELEILKANNTVSKEQSSIPPTQSKNDAEESQLVITAPKEELNSNLNVDSKEAQRKVTFSESNSSGKESVMQVSASSESSSKPNNTRIALEVPGDGFRFVASQTNHTKSEDLEIEQKEESVDSTAEEPAPSESSKDETLDKVVEISTDITSSLAEDTNAKTTKRTVEEREIVSTDPNDENLSAMRKKLLNRRKIKRDEETKANESDDSTDTASQKTPVLAKKRKVVGDEQSATKSLKTDENMD